MKWHLPEDTLREFGIVDCNSLIIKINGKRYNENSKRWELEVMFPYNVWYWNVDWIRWWKRWKICKVKPLTISLKRTATDRNFLDEVRKIHVNGSTGDMNYTVPSFIKVRKQMFTK